MNPFSWGDFSGRENKFFFYLVEMIVGEKLVDTDIFSQGSQKVFSPVWENKIHWFCVLLLQPVHLRFYPSLKQQLRSPGHISSFLFFSLFPLHSTAPSLESLPIQILLILSFFLLLFSLFTCSR